MNNLARNYIPIGAIEERWQTLMHVASGLHPEDIVTCMRDIAASATRIAEEQHATNERIGTPDRNEGRHTEALLEELFGQAKEVRVSDFNVKAPPQAEVCEEKLVGKLAGTNPSAWTFKVNWDDAIAAVNPACSGLRPYVSEEGTIQYQGGKPRVIVTLSRPVQ